MNVTFLDEAVQIGKLSDLPAYLKSIRDPRFKKLLDKFEKKKNTAVYPDETPSGWFPLRDGSVVIGCCGDSSAYPIDDGYPFGFYVLGLDEKDEPHIWTSGNYSIIVQSDIYREEDGYWITKELQKAATGLAKKLTKEYAQKKFANFSAIKKFLETAPSYKVFRTGDILTSFDQKPDASQKVRIEKR